MNGNDVTKEHYQRTIKQRYKLEYVKTLINPGLEKSKVVTGRKILMREFDPECICSRKEAVGMEHVSDVRKI